MRGDPWCLDKRMWLLTRTCVLVAGIALMAFFTFAASAEAVLEAGAAKLTITPPECSVGGACPGYSLAAGNGRFSTGVHDDIWARALVMTSGNDTVILVVLDVLGHLPDRIRGMQAALRAAYPGYVRVLVHDDGETDPVVQRYVDGTEVIENVLIANAHTHASPDCIGVYGPDSYTTGRNPAWMDYVDSRVVEVVGMAIANLQPAKVRFNNYYVPDYLGFPLITDRREPIVIDHTMGVMQLANSGTDDVICTLVNYSGYPEMMGILENTKMTADFPGVMDQSLEAYFGGVSIWVTRVIGGFTMSYYDVNFNGLRDDDSYPPNNHLNTFPGMTAYGELIADVAKEALVGVPYEGSPDLNAEDQRDQPPDGEPALQAAARRGQLRDPGPARRPLGVPGGLDRAHLRVRAYSLVDARPRGPGGSGRAPEDRDAGHGLRTGQCHVHDDPVAALPRALAGNEPGGPAGQSGVGLQPLPERKPEFRIPPTDPGADRNPGLHHSRPRVQLREHLRRDGLPPPVL